MKHGRSPVAQRLSTPPPPYQLFSCKRRHTRLTASFSFSFLPHSPTLPLIPALVYCSEDLHYIFCSAPFLPYGLATISPLAPLHTATVPTSTARAWPSLDMERASAPIFLALSFLALCSAVRHGQWEDLSKSGSLTDLSKNTWSFNKADNLAYCNRTKITIPADGRKDYTGLFNDALLKLGKQGGGTLQLLQGTYNHYGQIKIPSYVCLVGAGKDETIIRLVDNAPRFPKSGSIRSMHTERVTVANLTQDGNRDKQRDSKSHNYGRYGFFSELTNYLYIYNVRVRNNFGYGYDPHGSKKYYSYYLIIENCDALNNGLDGFTIDQTVHATIINGFSKGNRRHGYNVVTGTKLALFRTSISFENGENSTVGYGFVAQNNQNFGTSNIAFESCTATDNYRGAFKLNNVSDVTIKNSRMSGNGASVCYELSRTHNVKLKGNECSGVRASRKFKLSNSATYTETADRSRLTTACAAPPPQSRNDVNTNPRSPPATAAREASASAAVARARGVEAPAAAQRPMDRARRVAALARSA